MFDVLLAVPTAAGHCGVGLRNHVARFLRSAEMMGMEDVGEIGDLERAIAETVLANVGPASPTGYQGPLSVKIIAAWVEQASGLLPTTLKPTVFIVTTPVGVDGSVRVLESSAKVRSADMPKIPAEVLPPSLKVAASYTPGLREQLRSRAMGFDHTAFRTVNGDLAESTTLSMMVVTNGRILVPPLDNVLDGVTRRLVLDIAHHQGIPVEVRAVRWDEVRSADELLLVSTSNVVVPISDLDDVSLSAPGPITESLATIARELLAGDHSLSDKWLTKLTA